MSRILSIALATAFFAAAILAPTATAQKPSFSYGIDGVPPQPVTPVEQNVQIDFEYVYSLPAGNPAQSLAGTTNPAKAEFTVSCPADKILVSGSTSKVFNLAPSQNAQEYTGTVTVFLTVLREAPGMTPITCDVSGSVGEVTGTALPASDTIAQSFTITPDYLPYIEAQSASKLRQGGPQKQIPFAIDLTNFGNAATKITFSIESAPKGKWQGLLPDPALLDPPGGNLQTKQIVFNVATPYKNGWNNDEGAFTIAMKPEYQYNAEKTGSPVTVTVLARVRGVYVPSLEPMVMVAAIIGTALVLRLQKQE